MLVRLAVVTCVIALFTTLAVALAAPAPVPDAQAAIARGKYLVVLGACNDCHTPGWRESDGQLPVAKWLVGSSVGLRQDWGTSYPANLRVLFSQMTSSQWLFEVRTRGGRMQWHDLRALTIPDQLAIYRFVHSLGPKGGLTLDDVPADREPSTPYIDLRLRTPDPHE